MKHPLVQLVLDNQPIVLWFDKDSGGSWGYAIDPTMQAKTWALQDGVIIDLETESVCDLKQGRAIEGPLKEFQLQMLPLIPTAIAAWKNFYPDARRWSPDNMD